MTATVLSTEELNRKRTREELDDFLANGHECKYFKRNRLIRQMLELALKSGLDDVSYPVGRTGGFVPSYAGTAIVVDNEGRTWVARGFRSEGRPDTCLRVGRVEFTLQASS